MDVTSRIGITDTRLITAIVLMEQHIEEPLTLSAISEASGASVRNLERLFRVYLDCSPTAYYRTLRLNAARQLLLHGSTSILDVALATGFVSASHFARCYRATFGRSPRDDRMVQRASARELSPT
jgi:transcriptional regulator GlxA family with amidase domain